MATTISASSDVYTLATERPTGQTAAMGAVTTVKLPVVIDDGKKPNLTILQLIALAILIKQSRSATAEEIGRWIHNNVRFYREEAIRKALDDVENMPVYRYTPTPSGLFYDVRLHLEEQSTLYEPVIQRQAVGQRFWDHTFTIVPGAEETLLAAPSVASVTFPFMRLPTELRLRIYRNVLQYSTTNDVRLAVLGAGRMSIHRNDPKHVDHGTRLPPMWSLLALLSVSKQVNCEALPIFYRYNHFYFGYYYASVFKGFMKSLGPQRREHLAYITVEHEIFGFRPNAGLYLAFKLLAESKCLRTFSLTVRRLHHAYDEDTEIPGFKFMDRLRGLKQVVVDFEGMPEGEQRRAETMRANMLLPKPDETEKDGKTATTGKNKSKIVVDKETGVRSLIREREDAEKSTKTVASRKRKAKATGEGENGKPSKKRSKPKTKTASTPGATGTAG